MKQASHTMEQLPTILSPFDLHPTRFKASMVIAWSSWALYMVLQYIFVSLIQASASHFVWQLWMIVFAESLLTLREGVIALNIIFALFSVKESVPRPSYRLTGMSAPSVDILITCCGEAVDIIVDTVIAAVAQDYPLQQFRVFVLDDGHDEKLRNAITTLNANLVGKKATSIIYLARKTEVGVRSYFKSGNLRFGIEESERLGSSEFVAGLDADMIPESDWLCRMLPHLMLDEKVALANPPQCSYNVPDHDPLGQQAEFDRFSTLQETLNDYLGAVMCTGSGYVARRSALAEIGGWPLVDTGEDYMCSTMLMSAGWKTAFVREKLQSGLATETLRAAIKQRTRWIEDVINVSQHFGYYLPGSINTSKMILSHRVVNLLYSIRDHSPATTSLALLLLPIALYSTGSNETTIALTEHQRFVFWLRKAFLVMYISHKINTFVIFSHIGLSKVANFTSFEVWMAPYMAYCSIIPILPAAMRSSSFEVSGTITSPINERSHHRRKPLPYRLLSPDMFLYTLYAIYASMPIVACLIVYTDREGAAPPSILFPGAMVRLLGCAWSVLVPVRYMIWPPTVPERAEMLKEDDMGAKRPRKGWEKDVVSDGIWWTSLNVCEICIIWLCISY